MVELFNYTTAISQSMILTSGTAKLDKVHDLHYFVIQILYATIAFGTHILMTVLQ